MYRKHLALSGLLCTLALVLQPIAPAQKKYAQSAGKPLMPVIGQPVQKVATLLGVKDTGKPQKDGSNYFWYFAFQYKGAEEGVASVVAKDQAGKQPTAWKVGVFFSQNIGEEKAMKLVGLNPKDWQHKKPDSYLSSKKHPHMLVKYNFKAGEFVNMETSPKSNALKWGLEIAKDPFYK